MSRFLQFTRIFTKSEISQVSCDNRMYQNLKYRVISCEPKKKISLMGGQDEVNVKKESYLWKAQVRKMKCVHDVFS